MMTENTQGDNLDTLVPITPVAADEVLERGNDDDSTFDESETQSELTSLRSSVVDYEYINGRRYHAYHAGSYWGPNDEQALAHLDLGHHIYNLLLGGKLYVAPIDEQAPQVLDVGTGTGIWAIEFADEHPDATVIGTDLSPTQPTWVPPNLSFEINDCCEGWNFTTPFDFIHVRGLFGSVADWNAFYAQAFLHLKPGGWIEQVEPGVVPKSFDGSTDGTVFEEWGQVSLAAGDAFGKTLKIVDEAANKIRQAGFELVTEIRLPMPIGTWPKDKELKKLGSYNRVQWEEGLEGWTMMILTHALGWQAAEVQVYLARMRQGLRDKKIHAYQDVCVVYARKPLNTS